MDLDRTWTAVRRHPSALLLVGQLLLVLVFPMLDDTVQGRVVLGVLSMAIVATAMWAVRFTPALAWVALVFGLPAMGFAVAEAITPDVGWVVLCSALLHVPFYFYVSWAMIRYLYEDDRVTRDELFAVGAAFTVVAWAFAYVYAAIQVISPGSFVGPGGDTQSWFGLLFLSFTNLTSVGLSDILPATDPARAVLMVQQVAGVLYVALVVARLVGLNARRHS